MDYQLWFYIVMILAVADKALDDSESKFWRVVATVFCLMWIISLINYLV